MRGQLLAVVLLALLGTTSCTTAKLEELRQIAPKGTPLQIALAREYLAYSEAEAANYDWADSYHFADKGLRSAYGQAVQPEDPADWDIAEDKLPELIAAHAELMAILENVDKVNLKPDVAARAQYFYDCWLEQQEEAWQVEEVAACRDGFHSALDELNAQAQEADASMSVPRTTAYMLFFDLDAAVITPEGRHVLEKITSDIFEMPKDTEIMLNGHTDTSGTDDHNMSLSEQRAKAVEQALVAGGVAQSRISYFAFGETDLRVQTADGIREPANRRVEIFLE